MLVQVSDGIVLGDIVNPENYTDQVMDGMEFSDSSRIVLGAILHAQDGFVISDYSVEESQLPDGLVKIVVKEL